jgi:colanic acid/amylovoran biosynthesis protein
MPAGSIVLTGDDALELIAGAEVAAGDSLGLCMRVAGYAGVDSAVAATAGALVIDEAAELQAPVVGLPVSRYAASSDFAALSTLRQHGQKSADIALTDITSPEDLILAAANCRAIVTGSYHAAVFGLAQGVPAVCLTRSSYYDAKFGGLQALFPGACFPVSLDAPDCAVRIRAMIRRAWHLPAPARCSARDTAVRLAEAGRGAYARLRAEVGTTGLATASESEVKA